MSQVDIDTAVATVTNVATQIQMERDDPFCLAVAALLDTIAGRWLRDGYGGRDEVPDDNQVLAIARAYRAVTRPETAPR